MTEYIPDDYRLQEVERTGYPGSEYESIGRCPVCDSELYNSDNVYLVDGQIVGCDDCLYSRNAEDALK